MLRPEGNALLGKMRLYFFSCQGLQTDAAVPPSTSDDTFRELIIYLYFCSTFYPFWMSERLGTWRARCVASDAGVLCLARGAGQQGQGNLVSSSVGISGCGCPEGLMGSLMIGPQISVANFHQPLSLGTLV